MINELRPEHVAACETVIASLPHWFGYEGALVDTAAALRSQRGLVALSDGEAVGFVTLQPTFAETVEITYLAVRSSARHRGFGRQLVRAARDAAQLMGATSLCLLTLGPSAANVYYDETVAFYRAIGFSRSKELGLTSWRGARALLMSAPLADIE